MRLVVFGLTVSSSWGNGHAALWRGLIRALLARGHEVVFFERDTPWYAEHRDLTALPEGGTLQLYPHWSAVAHTARAAIADADAAIVTSCCPDGIAATRAVLGSTVPLACFYDMDTPVTLSRLAAGEGLAYVGPAGLGAFDLVLSFAGGPALDALSVRLGARRVVPLYGWVDASCYAPASPQPQYAAALSYLGTYAQDRQPALERLLVEPARARPELRFVIAGAQYPHDFPWTDNIVLVRHLPPGEYSAFYASARLTLSVARGAMARMGWCPSGRLFEAAACGAPILSDDWPGLDEFFEPESEILVARSTADALAALRRPRGELAEMAARARERTLDCHTADRRAEQLVATLQSATARQPA